MHYPDLVSVTRVGISGQGIPIDMISIGNGPMSALFVGAPHPNEPVGCLVIEHLIERLCADPVFRQALPYRWHFIKAIEPDAFRLNEGWLASPSNLALYYENYYRPPINLQAEYTFPFSDDDRLARHPLPENLAWRRAIDLACPDFLFSLHNSEFGGAYFLASDMPGYLATTLKGLCGTYGLPLNTIGDSALNELCWEPGLYRFPDMKVTQSRLRHSLCHQPGVRWMGNSSAGYTSAIGTFSLFAEVPQWTCERIWDTRPSPHSRTDVQTELAEWNVEALALGRRALALDYAQASSVAINMWHVVQEHCDHFSSMGEMGAAVPSRDVSLSWSEYTIRCVGGQLERLSTVGLARRLALLSLDRYEGFRLADDCSCALSQQADKLIQTDGLRPVPLRRIVQFQLHAGLATMTALAQLR